MSNSVTVVTPKTSLLKRFGQEIVKIIGFVGTKVIPAEQILAPVAETLLPQFAPAIAAGAGIFERAVGFTVQLEGDFAAVGQASNGAKKFNALEAQIGPMLDQYIQAALPGSPAVLKADSYLVAKADILNAFVKFVNTIDGELVSPNPAPALVGSAAAAAAAVQAAGVKVG
jgi:hypothetical protein